MVLDHQSFFIIPLVCSIPKAMRNDYFLVVYIGHMALQYTYNNLSFAVSIGALAGMPPSVQLLQPQWAVAREIAAAMAKDAADYCGSGCGFLWLYFLTRL